MMYSTLASIFTFFLLTSPSTLANQLKIAIQVTTGDQRSIIRQIVTEFEEQHPGTKVIVTANSAEGHKVAVEAWLNNTKGPDIIHWQGGERIFQYIRNGKIADINAFWGTNNLSSIFNNNVIDTVSHEGQHYAVPISYYHWGFFYKKSIFKKLNISPPKTWEEFLLICEKLESQGITPIAIGTQELWPAAAWFDYFNLRINGLRYHRQLLSGLIPFTDPGVYAVFRKWKQLIDKEYFLHDSHQRTWKQTIPYIYHDRAGMMLTGNFFASQIPQSIYKDVSYFSFPIIDNDIPIYEEAPLDLFMIPNYSANKQLAQAFLLLLTRENIQYRYNAIQKMVPPHIYAKHDNDHIIDIGQRILHRASGLSQFYDRDTNHDMSTASIEAFADFMKNPNIEHTIEQLETARLQFLIHTNGTK